MISAFVFTTLAVVLYCLWVRRDTWWSRWEVGATSAIALEGCGLLLLTPWAAHQLSPTLHEYLRLWNVQQLVGFLCLIAGVLANIYHMLVRLTDPAHVWPIMRKHLQIPVGLVLAVMLVTFAKCQRGFEPDVFVGLGDGGWLTVFEMTVAAMVVILSTYVGRLMSLLRRDPRAWTTLTLYGAAMAFATAAGLTVTVSIVIDIYAGPVIWACLSLSVATFSYGLARSWQAKRAWFSPNPAQR